MRGYSHTTQRLLEYNGWLELTKIQSILPERPSNKRRKSPRIINKTAIFYSSHDGRHGKK